MMNALTMLIVMKMESVLVKMSFMKIRVNELIEFLLMSTVEALISALRMLYVPSLKIYVNV